MDQHAERKARKERKREEKIRRERAFAETTGRAKQTASVQERRQIGRYNLFLLMGLVLIASTFVFLHMH